MSMLIKVGLSGLAMYEIFKFCNNAHAVSVVSSICALIIYCGNEN